MLTFKQTHDFIGKYMILLCETRKKEKLSTENIHFHAISATVIKLFCSE